MVACETNDLEVPANAEIVLEGYVNLNEMRTEGPFGDHTGFYSLEGEYPVFHVGMRDAAERADLFNDRGGPAAAGRLLHGVRGGASVPAGDEDAVSGNCGCGDAGGGNFSQLDDRGNSKVVSRACAEDHECDLVAGAAMFTKVIVVVDHDVNIHNYREVVWKTLCALDPQRDVQFSLGPGGYAGPCGADAGFRIEDGDRCDAQVGGGRFYEAVAGRDFDGRRDKEEGRCPVEIAGAR